MQEISWDDFEKVEVRVGTVLEAEVFKEARIPAYIVRVDFGEDIGVLKSSARVTDLYTPEELVGRQVVGVVNFPPRQIGPIKSQFLLCGFYREDEAVVLCVPEREVPNGSKLG